MNQNEQLPRVYTKQELADILQLSLPTINRYLSQGLIKKIVLNGAVRFSQDEVNRLLGKKK